ncbi:hypothetical protein CLU79DRAFT_835916 [Phycomyces nitens]|nr:hypothetical protein CLU79DRAFT_835916 [Phycomyces nitens]
MGAQTVDYRMSKLIVLCKDCGNDVGMYPARHNCDYLLHAQLPPLTQIPDGSLKERSPGSDTSSTKSYFGFSRQSSGLSRQTSELSVGSVESDGTTNHGTPNSYSSKWARFQKPEETDGSYYDKFAANLPDKQETGKSLWGRVRQNEKWKQMTAEKSESRRTSGKLWGKLLNATQAMSVREDEPESDGSDYEGESHVSRILREYYGKQQKPLPDWMRESPVQRRVTVHTSENINRQKSGRRRLWESSEDSPTPRELERHSLRSSPRDSTRSYVA